MAQTQKPRVAVIGAGMGGLAAAVALSRHCEVRLFERAAAPGGKVSQTAIGDARIDSGPTVFTMRWVFDALFEKAGARFDDHVSLSMLNRLARHGWRDGSRLDLYRDEERSAAAIADFAGRAEAERYRSFLRRTKEMYETLRDPFLLSDRPDMVGLLKGANPLALGNVQPFSSMWKALSKQFRDPRLRQLFARYATYCGSSPFDAPATLALIAHVEQSGVWTLDGGMAALARALETVARDNGVETTYDAHVEEIIAHQGRARGVVLQSGARVDADAVIVNGDAAAVANGGFGRAVADAVPPAARHAQRSQSAMTWTMLGAASGFDLSVHNVFFSDDYREEFDCVFRRKSMAPTPTTYIFAPDRHEDGRQGGTSPGGDAERLFCLVNAPAIGDAHVFTEQEIDQCEERMNAHLRQCGLTIAAPPDHKRAATPNDFAERFPGTGGAIYGMASHGWRASFQRPGVRTTLRGLYLAGGSVHPGPGVPMAALSGQAAARAVLKDCGLTAASPPAATPGGTRTR